MVVALDGEREGSTCHLTSEEKCVRNLTLHQKDVYS